MQIQPIPAFSDNYIWALSDAAQQAAAVVDPGDAVPVLRGLAASGTRLVAILITHHHADHVGGVRQLLARYPGIPVYGPAGERIPAMTHPLKEGDRVSVAEIPVEFQIMDVPGHTAGHIAYYTPGRLFCGDTLFACGCGRVFDGSLQALDRSLGRIAALPEDTLIYCAHEYTLDNIGFAKWVEPDNPALLQREEHTHSMVSAGQPSVPSRLSLERLTNPFLRVNDPAVMAAAEKWAGHPLHGSTEVFSALRTWKDTAYD